ncbi:uncharacterized protein LOC116126398 isoform X1 [Pistacia vera]|uniref:uncharacterized protein LOC116126398 isoform X1 n=1 Tax=Pistacia vera TaxID=55513 RepID=UPI0012639423|nr:uncharacterized protein LOC116126398 isoform X1 [Pistacia vera]
MQQFWFTGLNSLKYPRWISKSSQIYRIFTVWNMTMDSKSSGSTEKQDLSIQLQRPLVPQLETLRPSDLKFDRLQPSDQELVDQDRFQFGKFVAREAVLDEEYWVAAWLRAESHWEDQTNERYVDNYKRKFAEQEFNAIKRRCRGQHWQKYLCIVTVKKEERNVKRTILKSVVGTLDLSIRYLLHGETYPGERVMAPLFGCINKTDPNRYGYIANLCVAKSARRQGIARNMLHFTIESAKSNGKMKQISSLYKHMNSAENKRQLRRPPDLSFGLQMWIGYMCMCIEITNLLWNCMKRWVSSCHIHMRWLEWEALNS